MATTCISRVRRQRRIRSLAFIVATGTVLAATNSSASSLANEQPIAKPIEVDAQYTLQLSANRQTESQTLNFATKTATNKKTTTKNKTTKKETTKKETTKKKTTKKKATTIKPSSGATSETTTTMPVPATVGSTIPAVAAAPPAVDALSGIANTPTTTAAPAVAVEPAVFRPCNGVQCAEVRVPRDYRTPSDQTVTLFVSRRPATRSDLRIGVLMVNPGGPGGPALDLVRTAERLVSPAVLERFDIIGVDPRGTDRSTPLRCNARPRQISQTAIEATPLEARETRTFTARIATSCAQAEGTRLDYMDTETAARDLDAVRVALGEERISYLGISYGTYLGAVYESLFPERTRAAILDSAIDPNRFGVPQITDRYEAVEKALDGFLAACADGRLNPCAFRDGTDLGQKYVNLRNRVAAKGAEAVENLDETVSELVGFPRNGWPVLGRALQELWVSDTANFSQLPTDSQSTREPSSIRPLDTFSTYTNLAVICRDGLVPRTFESYIAARDAASALSPRFSTLGSDALIVMSCIDWPSAPIVQVPLRPSAPTVVVANTFDLTTPLRWSEGLAATLNAPMIIREGGGHGGVDKSQCVRDATATFLLEPGTYATPRVLCPELAWL